MSYMIFALIVSTRPKLEGTVADGEASNSESKLIWWFHDRLKKASGVFWKRKRDWAGSLPNLIPFLFNMFVKIFKFCWHDGVYFPLLHFDLRRCSCFMLLV